MWAERRWAYGQNNRAGAAEKNAEGTGVGAETEAAEAGREVRRRYQMEHISYEYYTQVYLGVLIPSAEAFNRLSARAWAYLAYAAGGALDGAEPDAVNCCVCELAEVYYSGETGEISSETAGRYSRTFRGPELTEGQRLSLTTSKYLASSGALYRGVD